MIHEVQMYSCTCDNCGELFRDDHSGFTAYPDSGNLSEAMDSDGWHTGTAYEHEEKYYCPDCFKWDDNEDDKIIIDKTRTKTT
jgi:hypothetical protein